MSQRMMVAIDGGRASRAALDWAIAWSHFAPIELELCAVTAPNDAADSAAIQERALRGSRERVVAANPSLEGSTTVLHGVAAEKIILRSGELSCLVVGSAEQPADAETLAETLQYTLASSADCPVVVVPLDWQNKYGPVVVGVDSTTDDAVLDFACRAATRLNTTLVLVHAWDAPTVGVTNLRGAEDVYEEMKKAGHRMLADATVRLRRSHPGVRVLRRLVFGEAPAVITRAADKAALVVVGTHRAGSLGGSSLGRTGQALLAKMPSAVAIVPAHLRRADSNRTTEAVIGGGVALR